MSKHRLKLEGQKFGKLTVIRFSELRKFQSFWLCLCDCGNEAVICGSSLKRGKTKSCGCLTPNFIKGRMVEYRAWLDAKHRCYNEKNRYYKIYGGRGIKVCESLPHASKKLGVSQGTVKR